MQIVKKLLFAPLFVIFFFLSLYFLNPFLGQTDFLLSLDPSVLVSIILLSISVFLTTISFAIFGSLANNWLYIGIVTLLAVLLSLLFQNPAIFIFGGLSLLIFLLGFWGLSAKLKTYLTFDPKVVLGGTIKSVGKLLVIALVITYLFSIKGSIEKNGFQLPDSLLNTALKFAPNISGQPTTDSTAPSLPNLTDSQINLLKQNSGLLQQFGINPSELDQIQNQAKSKPSIQGDIQNTEKGLMKTELQAILSPITPVIPYILALLFLSSVYFFLEIFTLFNGLLLSLIFGILESTHFVHFEVEQREVKKMVV